MKRYFLRSIRVRIIITVILLISTPFAILQLSNTLLVYSKLKEKRNESKDTKWLLTQAAMIEMYARLAKIK